MQARQVWGPDGLDLLGVGAPFIDGTFTTVLRSPWWHSAFLAGETLAG